MALWLLSVLLAFVTADWPYVKYDYELAEGKPLLTTKIQANLKSSASFILTHTSAVQVCFNENFPVPPNASNWRGSCTFQFSLPAGTTGGQVFLRNAPYSVGIYFDGSDAGKTDKISFSVGSSNDTCTTEEVFNNGTDSCQAPVPLKLEETQNFTFVANIPQIFSVNVTALTGSVSLSTYETTTPLSFAIRRAGSPSLATNLFDGTTGATATITFPRPGIYYVYALSPVDQRVNLNVSHEDCRWADHASGPQCETEFNHDDALETVSASEGSYYYWAVYNVGPQNPLRVSVFPKAGHPFPIVYASRGNLPQKGNAEIVNCNVEGCNSVSIISRTPSSNETWYIAATAAPGANGTKYSIWFGSVCYPGCENGGTCSDTGSNIGVCSCTDPRDSGAGCQLTQKVAQQYVVLAAIWGTAFGVTVVVLGVYFLTSQKQTFERIA